MFFDIFDDCLQKKQHKVYSSDRRAWGKTTILNELGITYQALGYEVLLLTMFPNSNEHFATRCINDERDLRGLPRDKTIMIVDEYKILNDKNHYLFNAIEKLDIPYVGFM